MSNKQICWYTRRNELAQGQVFKCLFGGVVMLDSRVAGDGTKERDEHD